MDKCKVIAIRNEQILFEGTHTECIDWMRHQLIWNIGFELEEVDLIYVESGRCASFVL